MNINIMQANEKKAVTCINRSITNSTGRNVFFPNLTGSAAFSSANSFLADNSG
jgi:hypothetical protein